MSALPPLLASEVSARLLAVEPMIREFFNLETVTISGTEMEKLCLGVWLMGYSEACGEMADASRGELPALAALIESSA